MKALFGIFVLVISVAFIAAGGFIMMHGNRGLCPLSLLGGGTCMGIVNSFAFAMAHIGMMLRISSVIVVGISLFAVSVLLLFLVFAAVLSRGPSDIVFPGLRSSRATGVPRQGRKINRWLSFHENSPSFA